ncbi:DsbA family protein [Yoonia litorea]|uniref:Protein-disulfide isomerase n=1 Tax=Yoonia litorea TaxID=1123755 RepID=A0A1I6N0U6_9RHOB|nr:DsbA family protein [Yoonia litorea]SFS21569.1 Protein-disulfide isomerase [Yoonia litorea]
MFRKIGLACALAVWPLSAVAQELSEDRVKELALQAILENPQIIIEAVAILEQERQAAQMAAGAQVLQERRDFLEGDPNAPYVGAEEPTAIVVEFFDYNCPYCKRAAADVKALLGDDEDVRVVYREWPILGEGSVFAARAALAAREQGKYEEMHWALMELRGRAEEASIIAAARDLGLDIDRLRADMESAAVTTHIEDTRELAQALGITGTPAFVIGDAVVPGAVPLEDLQSFVAQARSE